MHNEPDSSGKKNINSADMQNGVQTDNDIDEYDLYYGESAVIEPAAEKPKQPGPLSRRPEYSSAIPFLFLAMVFVLFTFPLNNYYFPDSLWASRETVFVKHQYWRLVTAVFTHADIVHLLSNIPLFFFFGIFLFEYFGFLVFPVVPLIIGTAANAFTLWFYPDTVKLFGASGMVYGMASLWLVLYIYHDTDYTVSKRVFRSIAFTLMVLFPTTYNPETSYLAHAAGFFLGIISALALLPFAGVKVKKLQ